MKKIDSVMIGRVIKFLLGCVEVLRILQGYKESKEKAEDDKKIEG